MYLIVGCGLTGVVIAERIANKLNKKVIIIEKKDITINMISDTTLSTGDFKMATADETPAQQVLGSTSAASSSSAY